MKITGVKYMRDFYPEDMRVRSWIEGHWRQASLRAGFEEWDAPIVEHLDLYKRKSGDEIVGQLYSMTDKGDRELAIRPEMTPSLARMVAARQGALKKPVKWFCVSRMCRYERGQRGRLREFWQWNIDMLGAEGPLADAEVISVALDALASMGLGPAEVGAHISSRTLLATLLTGLGVPEDRLAGVYAALDKRGKISAEAAAELYGKLELDPAVEQAVLALVACETLDEVEHLAGERGVTGHEASLADLRALLEHLDALGKKAYCRFDIGIVRGLAYYTGTVFELFDRQGDLRALAGGGRYDDLMQLVGGQPMAAVGFGLGDVVLSELLRDTGKLPTPGTGLGYYVIPLSDDDLPAVLATVRQLRENGHSCDYALRSGGLSKAMKRAHDRGAAHAVLVGGDEATEGGVRIKDLSSGQERTIPAADL